MENIEKKENFFKRHADTFSILGAFAASILWMNGKFNDVDKQFSNVDVQFSKVEKDIAIIKTVLFMKDIYPKELVKHDGEK